MSATDWLACLGIWLPPERAAIDEATDTDADEEADEDVDGWDWFAEARDSWRGEP